MISDEFKNLFYKELELDKISLEEQERFLMSMTRYLDHGRKEELAGRTYDFVSNKLVKLMDLLECMGFNKKEMVQILGNLPNLLNSVDELYKKYLFLGIIENEENSFRKNKLLNRTRDYMVGLSKIYARYKLICEAGYDNLRWNSLVHASDKEFARIFVRSTYVKPYQLFDTEEQVYEWLENVNFDELNIEEIKCWDVNEELVRSYEGSRKEL